ncbi:MAG: ABC transporter ATP-binding protein [Candidatus Thermoplasmatota archaeon]|nr:ABC transporter ATP-binding protein [Candidatus Thermoplasmatota archaeon]MEC7437120.1 ABC transporter ATP-binding protein [Candidatus Thermoplasmatota archaeon]MEC7545187.1 ABC transporter ATP-binding protein [Candidatus Thermoplasmatota archaeon]MEC8384752.1 ABC transporter ATP-binding protein [Candidatus Thermoplasmatota archaeon]MED5376415.1 ABC transporter ATP-binding protein [Candidatus Thermoplasmatota archaeon]
MTSINSDWLIEAKSLTKNYGPHVALDNVDIQLPHGSIGLLGPNGAGKSTLIKTLLGLIQITSGEGTVLGHDIRTEGDAIRSKIGYMAEYDTLNPDLNAVDQVRYSGELLGMSPVVANQRTHEVMEYVGLRDQRYRKIGTFSTGMQQSAKLACAIIHDPELLIVDEPSNGLDQEHRGFMLDTLFNIVKDGGRSILMSSHLMDDVQIVCDRVIMIHKGRVVVHRRIEDLARQIDREIEISVWGGASKMEQELKDSGLTVRRLGRIMRVLREDESTVDQILSCAAKASVQIRQMEEYEPSLEDLFLLIMDKLGYGTRSASELLNSTPSSKVLGDGSIGGASL